MMDNRRLASVALTVIFISLSWNSQWFEIEGKGTYSEGLEREPSIITTYSIDSNQQTLDVSILNATPLLMYWLEREDVTIADDVSEENEDTGIEAPKEGSEVPKICSESCLDLARISLGIMMLSLLLVSLYSAWRGRLGAKLALAASWILCSITIIFLVPLAAAVDFGIFSGSDYEGEDTSTGGFDSNTQDSVSVNQFAHFSSNSNSKLSSNGLIFTYQSSGFDLGLVAEENRENLILNPPEKGEEGFESFIQFDGELAARSGPMLTWWFLTLPTSCFLLVYRYQYEEEEEE